MYQKVECIILTCDNCRETYQDEDTGFSIFVDKEAAHEAAANDGWYLEDKHYCPDCHIINDEDKLVIDMTRTNPKDWESKNEPVKESIVDDVDKAASNYYWEQKNKKRAVGVYHAVEDFKAGVKWKEQQDKPLFEHLESVIKLLEQQLSNQEDKRAIEFAKWLDKNTLRVKDNDRITLYRYCDKDNQYGNYILEDIYKEFKQSIK